MGNRNGFGPALVMPGKRMAPTQRLLGNHAQMPASVGRHGWEPAVRGCSLVTCVAIALACGRQPDSPSNGGVEQRGSRPASFSSTNSPSPVALAPSPSGRQPSPGLSSSARHGEYRRVLTDDAAKVDVLQSGRVTDVALASGGRSVAFKVTFADGSRALFKPEQSFAAHWFAEVCSFHLDRALALGRVPAAVGRRLHWKALRHAAEQSKHVDEVRVAGDGTVKGAMIWWLSGELVPLSPPAGWEGWLRVEPAPVSPFQRRSDYQKALERRGESPGASIQPPASDPDRAAELSDTVLFDYLTANHDRWGGDFTNVRTLGRNGPLVLIDNANGFPPRSTRDAHIEAQLDFVQRFRQRTVDAIVNLNIEQFRAALDQDELAPLLTQTQLDSFEKRRARLIAHVHHMHERFGARAFPW